MVTTIQMAADNSEARQRPAKTSDALTYHSLEHPRKVNLGCARLVESISKQVRPASFWYQPQSDEEEALMLMREFFCERQRRWRRRRRRLIRIVIVASFGKLMLIAICQSLPNSNKGEQLAQTNSELSRM